MCHTGPRFFRAHPKDRPIQSPLTTREGIWRIYSNPDPHGVTKKYKTCYIRFFTFPSLNKTFHFLFFYSRTSNFPAIWRLSLLPVTGLKILAYARRSGPLSREGSLPCHTNCDTGPRFTRSHTKDRHPCPTVGFEPPTQGSSDHCARPLTIAPRRRLN